MAFNEQLAKRVRDVLADVPDVSERRMFGGLTFLVGGHMACGIVGTNLMLRLGEPGAAAALDYPHARPMDFTGRPIRTMIYVTADGVADHPTLREWVERAVDYVRALPAKA
jgi:TfoX/Sxy family transcriptional regulator of competence genes